MQYTFNIIYFKHCVLFFFLPIFSSNERWTEHKINRFSNADETSSQIKWTVLLALEHCRGGDTSPIHLLNEANKACKIQHSRVVLKVPSQLWKPEAILRAVHILCETIYGAVINFIERRFYRIYGKGGRDRSTQHQARKSEFSVFSIYIRCE